MCKIVIFCYNLEFQDLKEVKALLPESITWGQLHLHAAVAQVLHKQPINMPKTKASMESNEVTFVRYDMSYITYNAIALICMLSKKFTLIMTKYASINLRISYHVLVLI